MQYSKQYRAWLILYESYSEADVAADVTRIFFEFDPKTNPNLEVNRVLQIPCLRIFNFSEIA